MLTDDELDEYVSHLLTDQAKRQASSYSTLGFRAFLRTADKDGPTGKPNTNFLKNVVRSVDGYNNALTRKEERESREKLKELQRRGVGEEEDWRVRRQRDRSRSPDRSREKEKRSDRRDYESDDRKESHRHSSSRKKRSRLSKDSEDEDHRPRRRHRERSVQNEEETKDHHRHHRDRKRREHEERSSKRRRDYSEDSHEKRHQKSPSRKKRHGSPTKSPNTSSSDEIGPSVPTTGPEYVVAKGRGRMNGGTLSAKFSESYDPRTDTADYRFNTENEKEKYELDDWDIALRALRERQSYMLSAQMTDRLKDTEAESRSVKWPSYSKGEREWDKGKVILDDGSIGVKVLGEDKALE